MSNGGEINEAKILAYLNKELSNEEMVQVDLWLAKSSSNMQKFTEVRKLWRMTGRVKHEPVSVDTDQAWNKVMSQIDSSSSGKVVSMQPQKSRLMFAVAAGILVLVGAISVMVFLQGDSANPGMLELTAKNDVVNERLIDGTEVTLNKNSVLAYPPEFDENERRVKLDGECFFDVERDEQKPFIIDLPNDAYVKVLGTSFTINAFENASQSEVFVRTGKVEFGSNTDKEILIAGEKAILDNKSGDITKIDDDVHEAVETYWMDYTLDFHGETMEEVVEIFNLVYDDEVLIDCDELKNQQVNSTHKNESLESVLITLSALQNFEFHPEQNAGKKVYRLRCHD